VIRQHYKVSAAVFATTLLAWGLLAFRPSAIPMLPPAADAQAEAAHLVDVGHCRASPRELRFEWLKPGEEPPPSDAGQAKVCLALYPVPADQR